MTIYQEHRTWNPGDDEVETSVDTMPDGLWQVFEVDGGDHWVRNGEVWTAPSEGEDSIALSWAELLEEFGPVTDDEEQVQGCPVCGGPGCAGHTRVAGGAQ